MNELVSLFCPVYNISSRYPGALERFLDSIKNQTYTNIEVILVDDGSTDDSAAICDHWAQMDNRFRVVRHDSNKTITHDNINNGIFFILLANLQFFL